MFSLAQTIEFYLSDATRFVKKKKDIMCNEIEFYLNLQIHYQFAVVSQ